MFILRTITTNNIQTNTCLNKLYNLIIAETSQEEFEKTVALEEFYQQHKEKIYAFIIYDEGSKVIPLYKRQMNYIMTSDGKTFHNLTYKG